MPIADTAKNYSNMKRPLAIIVKETPTSCCESDDRAAASDFTASTSRDDGGDEGESSTCFSLYDEKQCKKNLPTRAQKNGDEGEGGGDDRKVPVAVKKNPSSITRCSGRLWTQRQQKAISVVMMIVLIIIIMSACHVSSFVSTSSGVATRRRNKKSSATTPSPRLQLQSSGSDSSVNDEIDERLARAKDLLEKSKAKLSSSDISSSRNNNGHQATTGGNNSSVPFFATRGQNGDNNNDGTNNENKREQVTKWKDDKTGLITTDGEKMAELSEQEQWESRSLLEVFNNEINENEDVYSLASQQLAERDVAASIFDLRKSLRQEDYKKIFDKRNFIIGEDN